MFKPLCFVIMPFGIKKDADGNEINFDLVYNSLIKPAIEAADMTSIRADEETIDGIIHKPMYERLILCDYAIADLTTANANVFYELGIRHAVKPYTTITLFSSNSKLPFDLNFLRCMPYEYHTNRLLTNLVNDVGVLTNKLLNAKQEKTTDSPIYQLVDGIAFQNSVAHEKTDIFRDNVDYNNDIKTKLLQARTKGKSKDEKKKAVDSIVNQLVVENEETGVLIDIMLSYRAIGDINTMLEFIKAMPNHVQQTVMVQEQLGFALNRAKEHEQAITVLEKVIEGNGPSSETYGIMGRVYKDLFDVARNNENEILAEAYLDKAMETYIKGFRADWRDAYPGVNAVTLIELKGKRERLKKLIPVVEYAVLRKLEAKKPEYWDYATLLELAIIENDESKAKENLIKALSCPIEGVWMFDTTLNNLKLIQEYRIRRDENTETLNEIIKILNEQRAEF